jgi:phosphoribosylanthranilate isomerase
MNRVRIKICGIKREDDALDAIHAGVDALGFVFVPGTPRHVEIAAARRIIDRLPPFVSRVGLFVDADADAIAEVLEATGIDTVQLHGEETPEFSARWRGRAKVMKAFRMRGPETLDALEPYRGAVDAWLLDAHVPGVAGGTGARFDWDLAVEASCRGVPIVLAGGLRADNVAEAVARVRPYAVDVSSGVESAPGRKDASKMRALVKAVRAADRAG